MAREEYGVEVWEHVAAKLALLLTVKTQPEWDSDMRIKGAAILLRACLETESTNAH